MKKVRVLVMVLVLMMAFTSIAFADANVIDKGFIDNQNDNARVYSGFYYDDAYLLMKWSKDWISMAHEDEGAWLTNQWEWYADSYSETDFYGYDVRTEFGNGAYKITELTKMKAVSDSEVPNLQAKGMTVIWGNIVVLCDKVEIYDTATGELIETVDVAQAGNPGLGNLKFLR